MMMTMKKVSSWWNPPSNKQEENISSVGMHDRQNEKGEPTKLILLKFVHPLGPNPTRTGQCAKCSSSVDDGHKKSLPPKKD